jgi:hypothetical protein
VSTEVEVFNKALKLLGESKEITSITAASDAIEKLAAQYYAKTRDSELRTNRWVFAVKRALLVADAGTNNTGWLYAYTVPTDSLRVLSVYMKESSLAGFYPFRIAQESKLPFEREKTIIYCNDPAQSTGPYVKYVEQVVDPALWDPNFEEMLITRLAEIVCYSLTRDQDKKKDLRSEYMILWAKAKNENAFEKEGEDDMESSPLWTDRG